MLFEVKANSYLQYFPVHLYLLAYAEARASRLPLMDRHHQGMLVETDAAVSKLASQCWLCQARHRHQVSYPQHQAYQTRYWLYSALRAPEWHCRCHE